MRIRGRCRTYRNLLLAGLIGLSFHLPSRAAEEQARVYDKQLIRLSEILGAIHYLRELCGADDGQRWRREMQDLVSAEGTTAFRRAQLIQSFNKGYRSYQRTYRRCTKSAETAIERFLGEGIEISQTMVKENP